MGEFYSEEIEVWFEEEPILEKKPGAPAGFRWRGEAYRISQVLKEWHEYDKDREHIPTRRSAERLKRKRGSWGVGRDYYRVRTDNDEEFVIYYDRRPKSREQKGVWVLFTKGAAA